MNWQPIETAPKDKRILLYYPKFNSLGDRFIMGCWDTDCYMKKPRPYWTNDEERLRGIRDTRLKQPTHWILPTPP